MIVQEGYPIRFIPGTSAVEFKISNLAKKGGRDAGCVTALRVTQRNRHLSCDFIMN